VPALKSSVIVVGVLHQTAVALVVKIMKKSKWETEFIQFTCFGTKSIERLRLSEKS
jgi:hypothetical protein